MAAPPAFVAKGSAAGETDVGAAGEAAAATIAALSMAGSPAATAGYQAAAAAASSAPARFPAVPVPPATAGRDAAAAQAAQAAQAQQGFAAMMAQMGAMGQMNPGAMGSFPPAAANWMLTYQHFLQQITAAAAAPGGGAGGGAGGDAAVWVVVPALRRGGDRGVALPSHGVARRAANRRAGRFGAPAALPRRRRVRKRPPSPRDSPAGVAHARHRLRCILHPSRSRASPARG